MHNERLSARRRITRGLAVLAASTLLATGFAATTAAPAFAANSDIGYPTFAGDANPVPATGEYNTRNQLQSIFDADVAAGAGSDTSKDFWFDKMLARTGTTGSNGDNNQWLFTRGRTVFMKEHSPSVLGFGGQVAYWESIDNRGAYDIALRVDGTNVALTEVTAERKQTPSYWHSVHTNDAQGLRVVQTKFITNGNVAVTNLEVSSTAGAKSVELRAASGYATTVEGDELTGVVSSVNNLTTVFPRFSGDGFTPNAGQLSRTLDVPAGGTVSAKVQLGFVTPEIEESRSEYDTMRAATPAAAFSTSVTTYNRWWADNVPYLDTPEDNIDKTLFYRWWLMRFNFLDANIPGNDYQFPTSMEGVLGYNNAIVLTTGMFIDDLKYFRDPIYSYGPWVSAGETSKSYKFVDNPGDPANWSNSYTQYISEAAWRAYQLHGGPTPIASNLAEYAEYDVKGLIDAYDTDDSGLIDYNWGAMTGNDADAVSFHERPNASMDRTENAYLYSNALASAEAYRLAGNTAKADEMDEFAQTIKEKVVELLWDDDENLLKHRFTSDGQLAKWKEINNYYPFTVGLMPKPGDADYDDDYVDALRLFADDKQYPIFPFYTANQADQADYGGPGSNNFSVINSTVTFRMLASVLRNYPTDAIDSEWYKKLLYWNAWSHYQNGGDNRLPDQNEFWSNGSADPQNIGYRSWIHHTILGTTNFTMIEDAMGLRPRTDAKIELDPIDIEWDHFTANNIKYRDSDLTITWDAPGGTKYYGADVPEGYSVFLDGELAFTVDELSHVTYDPATGAVEAPDGVTVTTKTAKDVVAPGDVQFASTDRVVDLFAKAGADIDPRSVGSTNLAAGQPVTATFSAASRQPEGAVNGTTINEPFWGTAGSPNAKDSIEVDLGSAKSFDDIRVFFYNSSSTATVQGYSEPAQYTIEYQDGSTWKPIPAQARTPVYPRANLNQSQFPEITTQKVRVTSTHAAGFKTGVKEVQVFSTGVEAPASTNLPPQVDAWRDAAYTAVGQARLVGTAKDDGLPGTDLTTSWSVISAPTDGLAVFESPDAATSVVRFTAAGEYTLRLTVNDGELSSTKDVVISSEVAAGGTNVAGSATPTAEFTAGWNNVNAVNNGTILHSGGAQTELWGTWSGSRPATRWLQYDWTSPVRVNSLEASFWADQTSVSSGAGVNIPKSWKAQYWDGAAWVDVENPSDYGVAREAPNSVTFDAVTTTKLRLVLSAAGPGTGGDPYAAVAVSEWKVFAEAPESLDPVSVRTSVGVAPVLPATVDAVFADGSRQATPVAWAPIDAASYANEGSFEVIGLVDGASAPAKATVWVRATPPGQINTIDPVSVKTRAGIAPALPSTVTVQYNDGSRQSGVAVDWADTDPAQYATDGTFTVAGAVENSPVAASATVQVGTGSAVDATKPVVTVAPSSAAPASGWYTGPVTVTLSATDNADPAPGVEYAVDGGAWTAYTEGVAVSADGSHTVQARARDAAGNVSTVKELTFMIDATKPAIVSVPDAIGRTVKASASDAGSGVASLEYRIGDAVEWTAYTRTILVGLDETVVHLRSADKAGNVTEAEPVAVAASDGNHRRNVALFAVPTASVTAGWNSVNGLNDDVLPTSSGDVTPNDNANVWGAWPEIGTQWVQYDWAETVTVDEAQLYFVSNLDGAGVGISAPKSYIVEAWNAETSTWVQVTNASEYPTALDTFNTVTFDPVATTKLRIELKAAGTTSGAGSLGIKEWRVFEKAAAVVPDTTAPALTVAVAPVAPASGWFTGTATITASAIDDRDDAPTVEAKVGDAEWAPYTAAIAISTDGSTTVLLRATDAAGNVSEAQTVTVKRDGTAPMVTQAFDSAARTVTLTGSDVASGVARIEYRIAGGEWAVYSAPFATGDAAVTIDYRASDLAGNRSESASVDVPAKPTGPVDPTDPTDPTDPGTPTDPGNPSEPSGGLTGLEMLNLGVTTVSPGGQVPVSLKNAEPGAVFRIELRSTPVTLGTLTVAADGTAQAVVTIPVSTDAGAHRIVLVNPGGELSAPITVVVAGGPGPDVIASTGIGKPVGFIAWAATLALIAGLGLYLTARSRRSTRTTNSASLLE